MRQTGILHRKIAATQCKTLSVAQCVLMRVGGCMERSIAMLYIRYMLFPVFAK